MLNNPFRKPLPQSRPRSEKCEIVVERKGDKIIKKIKGTCSKEQLQALADARDE